jgi:tetratricopeptide (TPR) repeat protein
VAALLTVLGLVRFDFQSHSTVADHYVYVALLGPALALAFLLSSRATDRILIVGGLVLIPLGTLARAQVRRLARFGVALRPYPRRQPAQRRGAHQHGHIPLRPGAHGRRDTPRRGGPSRSGRTSPRRTTNLGNALLRSKRPREAAAHFRAALAVHPDSVSGHFNLGLALSDMGDVAGATREYEEALRLSPDHAAALTNLAEIALNAGDLDKAAALYRRALAIDPDLAPARRGLSHALAGHGGSGPGAEPDDSPPDPDSHK